jgi:tetratricopeptide (TPR) repeat protein
MIRPGTNAAIAVGFALSALVSVPRTVSGQTPADAASCSIEEGSPREVATAFLHLNRAASASDNAAKMKSLRETVKSASSGIEKGQNVPGRNFIMAKAFVMMLSDSLIPLNTTRGELGLVGGQPAERVDLVVVVDSLLDSVEKAAPDCGAETDMWRQNKPWLDLLNQAIAAVDRNQLDSAEMFVNRTMTLHNTNPYGYQVVASIAARRNDSAKQMEAWQKAIEYAGTDTTHDEVRRQAQYYLGNLYAEKAQTAEGAEKVRLATEARKLYEAYLAHPADSASEDRTIVRGNLGIVMTMAGDSLNIPKLYADILANPDKYSVADHMSAGDMAARLNKSTDAVRFYENVLQRDPANRKALFNLAASYYAEKQYPKMVPTVHRLVAIDPSHADNWKLLGYAYAMMQPEEKDPAKKKALTDSIVKYSALGDTMTTDVTIDEFTVRGSKATVEGQIMNLDQKATKTYTIKFEFLDKAGTVVATKEATLTGVGPTSAKPFTIEVDQAGIASFRYAPVR